MINPILIDSLEEVLDSFDVVALDQWGVLHNGSICYPSAIQAMKMLCARGKQLIVLSNSGKRAELNWKRIRNMGLPVETVTQVITSGEVLWQDIKASRIQVNGQSPRRFYPICGHPEDPAIWAIDSGLEIADKVDRTIDAILLMGLVDGTERTEYDATFQQALELGIPMICTNPDRTSPRADRLVISPGALADRYKNMGGEVVWYGKPHAPVFQAVMRFRPEVAPDRFLMVGDSLEHDIAGAQSVGFKTALVRGGIHTGSFPSGTDNEQINATLRLLAEQHSIRPPDFSLNLFA